MLPYVFIVLKTITFVNGYSNSLFYLVEKNINFSEVDCGGFRNAPPVITITQTTTSRPQTEMEDLKLTFSTVSNTMAMEPDPFKKFQTILNKILFSGRKKDDSNKAMEIEHKEPDIEMSYIDLLAHFPSGSVMRAETFNNRSGVHLPPSYWMHRGHCYLRLTKDYMQTAVDAFSIFLEGDLDDVLRLPPMYVLKSARTIAMMKIAREKMVATWSVVKGDHETHEITYQTLELYRPLFKYVNGKEIARLNLMDDRILSYIGTHADLDRHQVGVIASKYIKLNPQWRTPRYLNLMNNLLCGVPMNFMRRVPENTYLQLSHQLFYHIRACDPLQRRFYLAMMSRTQVLGKSNSWSARDVARLGLLLTEVDGPELSAINPEAMIGVTAQVMMEMSARNLKYLSKIQIRYLSQQPLNILTKKINNYEDKMQIFNTGTWTIMSSSCLIASFTLFRSIKLMII